MRRRVIPLLPSLDGGNFFADCVEIDNLSQVLFAQGREERQDFVDNVVSQIDPLLLQLLALVVVLSVAIALLLVAAAVAVASLLVARAVVVLAFFFSRLFPVEEKSGGHEFDSFDFLNRRHGIAVIKSIDCVVVY